jgi:acetyltransferase-like isoleucine patch superfamily enzyme
MENKELFKKGKDVFICKDTNITRPHLINVGNHVAIDYGFHCTTSMNIGDYVHIGPHVSCIGGPSGEFILKGFNNVMSGARIVCGSDRFDDSGLFGCLIPDELKGKQIIKPIIMEEFSNVGSNAIVMPGTILRKGVLLTAGSLLIGDTEEWGIYKGNPAVLIKKIDGSEIVKRAKQLGYEF